MRIISVVPTVVLLAGICSFSASQTPIRVDEAALRDHVISHGKGMGWCLTDPIGRPYGTEGPVRLDVHVDTAGNVVSTEWLAGDLGLHWRAMNCVRGWKFQPFEANNAPVPVIGPITVDFKLVDSRTPKDMNTIQKFYSAVDACKEGLVAKIHNEENAAKCKEAADIAQEFAFNAHFVEKRASSVTAASALASSGDLRAAMNYADRAVTLVKMGQDNDAGNASAYAVRGMIEARLGELSAANQDLSMAEESARKAISAAKKRHEGTTPYEHMLVQYLAVDAAVLKRLDRPDDAQKKIYEESQYH